MKIAVISDMHLGYARFEEDSIIQAANAFIDANNKADIIICAGDVFDTKIPKFETIKRAADIFRQMKIPVFVIHGNHERRSRDMVNPVQLLASTGSFDYLHAVGRHFEKDGEKLFVFGLGSVPEELASAALKKSLNSVKIPEGCFRVLVIHQNVNDVVPDGLGISLEELEPLPFDLIIDGHIHERKSELNGRFFIPGSTVVTQLKKEETAPRGYLLYDTTTRKGDFVDIAHRKFFFEELEFTNAGMEDVKRTIETTVSLLRKQDKDAIIKLKLVGTLRDGVGRVDVNSLSIIEDTLVFIDNNVGVSSMKEKIAQIKRSKDEKLSVREVALKALVKEVSGKITIFDPSDFFEPLCAGVEEAENYLKGKKPSDGFSHV